MGVTMRKSPTARGKQKHGDGSLRGQSEVLRERKHN